MATLKVDSRKNKETGNEYFEATVTLPGLRPTKLARADGSTQFSTRATVMAAAKKVSEKLHVELTEAQPAKTQLKKAAKKSTRKAAPAPKVENSCSGGSCELKS